MKIILSNGAELATITVTGAKKLVHGETRDTLFFCFGEDSSMDELDRIFSAENCEKITIIDNDGSEYVHSGYVIRAELKREPVEVSPANDTEPATYENRVVVSMSRRTYQESQYAELQEALNLILSGETGEG